MPEGTVDVIPVDLVVGAISAVAARGPANEDGAPDITQVASGSANPLKLPAAGRPRAATGSASTRCTTTRASRSSSPSGRSPAGAGCKGQLDAGQDLLARAETVAAGAAAARASRPSGRPSSRRSGEMAERALALRRAVRRLRRVRGDLRRRPPARAVGRARRRRPARTFAFDPRVDRLGPTTSATIHLPSVVQHARVRTDAGQGARRDRARPAAAPGAVARAPHRRVRPREHADRVERRRRPTRGWPPAGSTPTSGSRFVASTLAEAPAPARARPRATAATSCATSTAATRTRPVDQLDEDAAEMFAT